MYNKYIFSDCDENMVVKNNIWIVNIEDDLISFKF